MKAELIKEGRAVNPAYDSREHRQCKKRGEKYGIPMYLTLPVGFQMDDPLCWCHCCPGHKGAPPIAKPTDDECRRKVDDWMTRERPKRLEQIRQMARPENLRKMKTREREQIKDLAASYGLDTDDAGPVTPEPAPAPAKPEPSK